MLYDDRPDKCHPSVLCSCATHSTSQQIIMHIWYNFFGKLLLRRQTPLLLRRGAGDAIQQQQDSAVPDIACRAACLPLPVLADPNQEAEATERSGVSPCRAVLAEQLLASEPPMERQVLLTWSKSADLQPAGKLKPLEGKSLPRARSCSAELHLASEAKVMTGKFAQSSAAAVPAAQGKGRKRAKARQLSLESYPTRLQSRRLAEILGEPTTMGVVTPMTNSQV